jgi:hypothetical protein
MYNVLPLYTFNTYKLVVLHIITLQSHESLQTCDPPSSSSLFLSNVLSSYQKLLMRCPLLQTMLAFENYLMS